MLLVMIGAGWGLHGIEGIAEASPLLYTNLATFGFWVAWFMALVLLLPAFPVRSRWEESASPARKG